MEIILHESQRVGNGFGEIVARVQPRRFVGDTRGFVGAARASPKTSVSAIGPIDGRGATAAALASSGRPRTERPTTAAALPASSGRPCAERPRSPSPFRDPRAAPWGESVPAAPMVAEACPASLPTHPAGGAGARPALSARRAAPRGLGPPETPPAPWPALSRRPNPHRHRQEGAATSVPSRESVGRRRTQSAFAV